MEVRECSGTTTQLIQHHFWHLRHSFFRGITESHGTVEIWLQLKTRELRIQASNGGRWACFFNMIQWRWNMFSEMNTKHGCIWRYTSYSKHLGHLFIFTPGYQKANKCGKKRFTEVEKMWPAFSSLWENAHSNSSITLTPHKTARKTHLF